MSCTLESLYGTDFSGNSAVAVARTWIDNSDAQHRSASVAESFWMQAVLEASTA